MEQVSATDRGRREARRFRVRTRCACRRHRAHVVHRKHNDYPSVVGGKSNPNQFFFGRRSTAMRATTTVTDAVAAPRGSECG